MYSRPPNVDLVAFNTNAAANTDTTTTILAAPGAGLRYRIAFIDVFYNQSVTGVTRHQFSAGPWGCSIGAPGQGGDSRHKNFPEPGITLAANTALTDTHASSVATQGMRVVVGYYIDRIS